mgnify:CR=1 FL=1
MKHHINFTKMVSIKRIFKALIYSLNGIKYAFMNEPAFFQEALLSLIIIPIILILHTSIVCKLLLIGSVFLVMIVELINSAIEKICDLVCKEKNNYIKWAKDMGSSAVFLAILNFLVWFAVVVVF